MTITEKEAQKQLKKFQKDFSKLLVKYPSLMISSDINGNLNAYLTESGAFGKTHMIRLQ